MSRAEFDRAMPIEFWRDVVDRVAEEAPDTLLLAEAFWLMEGYFVRTLGMHRVYNSAFMNMLRDEKNAEYRLVVKNTLEFDPQILKRYVNFMNNPDERTAVDQFDKGDKYFGVCTLMVTMPGLPMFGHGQVEGFGERYGMEFRRPQLQEQPDPDLLARHEREIFPLLHRRELFAEVDDFLFYDFETSEGTVNEDVFAYTNRRGHERTLIVYHNRFSETRGWIRRAVGREGRGIADGLSLSDDPARYLVLRDQRTGLEYLHNQPELAARGLFLELAAYQCHVFLEIREVHDDDGRYAALATNLGGRGVSSVEDELALFALEPLRRAFASLVSPEMVDTLTRARRRGGARDGLPGEAGELARTLGREASAILGESEATAVEEFVTDVQAGGAAYLGIAERVADATAHAPATRADGPGAGDDTSEAAAILCWLALRGFGGGPDVPDRSERCRARIDEWRLAEIIAGTFVAAGLTDEQAWRAVEGVRAIVSLPAWRQDTRPPMEAAAETVHGWLADDAVRRFVGVNEHDGITWFERAGFSRLVDWAAAVAMVRYVEAESTDGLRAGAEAVGPALTAFGLADLPRIRALSDALRRLADAAGYRVDGLPTGRDEVSPVDVAPSRDGADD